ncbi:hypothetical protein K8I61_09600 [bacterium]|nr:hypothetical protein [bacterium]
MTRRDAILLYPGLALVTAGTLALEIVQTRILSVASWYHLAFFVISVAMFGMTLGALWVFARPERFVPERARAECARLSVLAGAAAMIAYLDQIVLAPEMVMSASSVVVFARLALTVSIPFVISGAAVTALLTRAGAPIGRAYGADLIGAAAGSALVIPMLSRIDGPGAVFACAAVIAAGGFLLAILARRGRTAFAAMAVVVLGAAGAYGNAKTVYGLDPIIVKGQAEKRHRVAYEKWNTFSRVIAYNTWNEAPKNTMWAASARTPAEPVDFVMMNIDGLAGTTVYNMANDPANVDFLRYDATAIAYAVRHGKVAVLGVGGGKDIMTALVFGNNDVLGVELNPALVGALRGPYRAFAGLADDPRVRLVVGDARADMARRSETFDIIQASLIDTWAATGAGAFTLSENAIYTRQAWRVFLDRLAPGGIFTVSRWYAAESVDETARLISLASAALFDRGVSRPAEHLMLAAHGQVATLLASNEPFSATDIASFRAHVSAMEFETVFAPGTPPENPVLADILAAPDADALWDYGAAAPLDLTPPSDDRPFFFNLLRLTHPRRIVSYLGRPSGVVAGNLIATLVLLTIVAVTLLLALATAIAPEFVRPPRAGRPGFASLAYFALVGLSFMLAEIAMLQRLSVFLGHPVYALAVVLFSLILFTGAGSLLSERFAVERPGRFGRFALLIAAVLAATALLLPPLTYLAEGAPTPLRILLSVLLLAPAGLLMGQAFPAGMRVAARIAAQKAADAGESATSDDGATRADADALPRAFDPTPWLFGMNGAAGVFGSTLAVVIGMTWGIRVTLLAAAAGYLLLTPLMALMTRGVRPARSGGAGASPSAQIGS